MTAPGMIQFHNASEPRCGYGEVRVWVCRTKTRGSEVHGFHGRHP